MVMDLDDLLSKFNASQQEAITSPLGNLAINAAAGTGKTSTLAARILYLQLEMDIDPDSILALSFSRTARMRLSEKLQKFCSDIRKGSSIPIYTFHGLAYRILRLAVGHDETFLKANFKVLQPTKDGSNEIFSTYSDYLFDSVKTREKSAFMQFFPIMLNELRQGTNEMDAILAPDDLPPGVILRWSDSQNSLNISTEQIQSIWKKYNSILMRNNAIDYCGMITEAIRSLRYNGDTLKRSRDGLRYILADEYQDTSRVQELLLFTLAGENICLNVVGDAGQTIYTFNGSSISNLLEFKKRNLFSQHKQLESICLTENYRSSENILMVANRIRDKSITVNPMVPSTECYSEPLNSYRNLNELVKIIHTPTIGLAADFVANEVNRLIKVEGLSPNDICILIRKDSEFSPQGQTVKKVLEEKGIMVNQTAATDINNTLDLLHFISDSCMQPEFYAMSVVDFITIGALRLELPENSPFTLQDISEKMKEYHLKGFNYCYEVANEIQDSLDAEPLPEIVEGSIQIRTIHSAKGEEFRAVFLLYLGDRSFPHGSRPDIDEERRLLYVGITRAQERLYILGRPGIHSVSFFEECQGEGTQFITYFKPVRSDSDLEDIEQLDSETLRKIEDTRMQQEKVEQLRRQQLRDLFDEDF